MKITDPISDLFTRIRNAVSAKHDFVLCPFSKQKLAIIKILKEEGFIKYYEVLTNSENEAFKTLKIGIKYAPDGRPVLSHIKRASKSGRRKYVQKSDIPKVLGGFGISILSTSKGVLSGRAARIGNVGGELIGIVY